MKVLIIGSGAREHALVWKIKQSKIVTDIFCAPGNAGISAHAKTVNIHSEDIPALLEFALNEKIELTIVGPEAPLVLGIVDVFRKNNLLIYGPDSKGAQLEGSKVYSKEFMQKYNIPTAHYKKFNKIDEAREGLSIFSFPLVIKADGLAAGKGVIICQDKNQALSAIDDIMLEKKFGDAGQQIVIEEFLDGIEASLLCFVSGNSIIPMESARDYKKALDNDQGLNTGGMGTFSPNPIFTSEIESEIKTEVLDRTLKGLQAEGIDFRGILFIGLMIGNNGVKVLEYNVRLGDPETEVVLPRLKSDLLGIFLKSLEGNLQKEDIQWYDIKCVTVVAASGGYPENYEKGKEIIGLDQVNEKVIVFHASTKNEGKKILSNGGRVLAVTATGQTIEEARTLVYKNIEKIQFEGMFYRKDIADLKS